VRVALQALDVGYNYLTGPLPPEWRALTNISVSVALHWALVLGAVHFLRHLQQLFI
jgi:hypothetical protein